MASTELKGIDISNAQGNIDWKKVKGDNVQFVIIRCGWGGDYKNQDDPKFNEYVSKCEQYGIPYGVYLYSYALTTDNARSEAQHTLRMLNGRKPKYGVWFDMEDADHYKQNHGISIYQSRQLITDICKTYCEAIKKAGYDVGIYANYDYWKNVIYKDQVSQYPIWLAIWGPSQPPMPCKIWQYTDAGHIDGITANHGRVDCNIMYSTETPTINKPVIIYGMRGEEVAEMQRALISKGYSCGKTGADGIYGQATKAALGAYQADHPECGSVDYKCGPKTWASLLKGE